MSHINIKKIRFSMLEKIELEPKNYDALVLELSESCLKSVLRSYIRLRELYGDFIEASKPVILIEDTNGNTKKAVKLLKRYFQKIAEKPYSNILFIYNFTEKNC